MSNTVVRLSRRQGELLERVCLKRYAVVLEHYMGSFRPNESVYVDDMTKRNSGREWQFRPTTVEALRSRGLVQLVSAGQGVSRVKPTSAGLEAFRAARSSSSPEPRR